jgi:hypothetical protein
MAAGVLAVSEILLLVDSLWDIDQMTLEVRRELNSETGDHWVREIRKAATRVRTTLLRASLSDLKVKTPDQPV